MPTINESLSSKVSTQPLDSGRPSIPSSFSTPLSVQRNPYLRCPVPSISSTATPDDLRQFYRDGQVPQYRVFA
jgi:hypothetical protein